MIWETSHLTDCFVHVRGKVCFASSCTSCCCWWNMKKKRGQEKHVRAFWLRGLMILWVHFDPFATSALKCHSKAFPDCFFRGFGVYPLRGLISYLWNLAHKRFITSKKNLNIYICLSCPLNLTCALSAYSKLCENWRKGRCLILRVAVLNAFFNWVTKIFHCKLLTVFL